MTSRQKAAIKKVVNARKIRNFFEGKYHDKWYQIDAATMKVLKELAK